MLQLSAAHQAALSILMQCTDTCVASTHLQVDCRWRGVGQQQHHEEEWVGSREYVPLVCQDNHASSCSAHTTSAYPKPVQFLSEAWRGGRGAGMYPKPVSS